MLENLDKIESLRILLIISWSSFILAILVGFLSGYFLERKRGKKSKREFYKIFIKLIFLFGLFVSVINLYSIKTSEELVSRYSNVLVTEDVTKIKQNDFLDNYNGKINTDFPKGTKFYKETPILNRKYFDSKYFSYVGIDFLENTYKTRYYYELPK